MKQELLYARVNLSNLPDGKKVQLVDNRVVYKDQKREFVLHQLDLPPETHFSFMNLKLSDSEPKRWYKVVWEVDTVKFDQISKKPYEIPNRKLFYSFMKQIYIEQSMEFLSRTLMNGLNDLTKNDNTKMIDWRRSRELGARYYYLDKNVIKIGKNYIDSYHGRITDSKVGMVTIKGGIIVDSSNHEWIANMIDSLDEIRKTLVVCSQNTVHLWLKLLEEKNKNTISISSKKDISGLRYSDLEQSEIVIVTTSFLTHKSYSGCWESYRVNDSLKLKDVFTTMDQELRRDPNFLDIKSPVLSLIEWNRLILDCDATKKMVLEPSFEELISTFKSHIRWLHIKQISMIESDIVNYLHYLINDQSVNFPLYSTDGKIEPLSNWIKKIEKKQQIVKRTENIKSDPFESDVDRFFVVQNSFNTMKVETVINNLIRNSLSVSELSEMIKKTEGDITSLDDCPICQDELKLDHSLFTRCGHRFCTHCAVKSCYLQGKCAICRTPTKFDDLYRIKESGSDKVTGSRYRKMIEIVKEKEGKKIVVIQEKEMMDYSHTLLDNEKISCSLCCGTPSQRNKIMEQFNNLPSESQEVLLIKFSDIDTIRGTSSIHHVIFVDTVSDINSIMSFSFPERMNYYFIVRQSLF